MEPDPMDSISEVRRKKLIEFPRSQPPVPPKPEHTPTLNIWTPLLYFVALCIVLGVIAYWLVHL